MGEYCDKAQSVSRSSVARSAARSALIIVSPWTSACALAAGMPTRRSTLSAARWAAASHRFEPLLAITTRGVSGDSEGLARPIRKKDRYDPGHHMTVSLTPWRLSIDNWVFS